LWGRIVARSDFEWMIGDAKSHDEKGVVVATAMLLIRVERLDGWRHLHVDPLVWG
jgi:hypothetical protein